MMTAWQPILKDGTPPAWMKPGVKVWTESTSGSPTRCTVIEPDRIMDGEWLLNSPEHGCAIQRHWRECEPENDQALPQGGGGER